MAEFRTILTPELKSRGFTGEVHVRLAEDGLHVAGKTGEADVPVGRIARLRAGVDRASKGGPFHEARVWVEGERVPMVFSVRRADLAGYLEVVGGLADKVPLERLETGLSERGRLAAVALLAFPFIAGLIIWATVLKTLPFWYGAAALILPALITLLGWSATRSWMPRQVDSVLAFKKALTG